MNKKRVLFLCIGNSCRSPMAEAFARKYGADVIEPLSAGLAPAAVVQPLTYKVLEDKRIPTEGLFPKDMSEVDDGNIDLIVNMSGLKLPYMPKGVEVRNWQIQDPIGMEEETYVAVRDRIERETMLLILELRRRSRDSQKKSSESESDRISSGRTG